MSHFETGSLFKFFWQLWFCLCSLWSPTCPLWISTNSWMENLGFHLSSIWSECPIMLSSTSHDSCGNWSKWFLIWHWSVCSKYCFWTIEASIFMLWWHCLSIKRFTFLQLVDLFLMYKSLTSLDFFLTVVIIFLIWNWTPKLYWISSLDTAFFHGHS